MLDAPIPSFLLVSVSHQASVHLSSVSPSSPDCFQGGGLSSGAYVKLSKSVVSITFLT